jgi:beta-phosphoglucomutase
MKLSEFSAFIFDMDGLVLDTEPTYFAAWRQALREIGLAVDDDVYQKLSGRHYSYIEAYLQNRYGSSFDLVAFNKLSVKHWRQHIQTHGIPVKTGVIELLEFAKRQAIPVCLATNSEAVYARECLSVAGMLDYFPLMVTGDDVEKVKPEPDIFLQAAMLMQVDIGDCLIFEDSHTGILAAAKAGGCAVYVPSILPVQLSTLELCHYVLDDLSQAFKII